MFVDDGAHAFLVLMVAVEESKFFLHQFFSFGDVDVFGREASVLVLDKDVHLPFFVEDIAVIVASKHFGVVPCLFGHYIVLCMQCTERQ